MSDKRAPIVWVPKAAGHSFAAASHFGRIQVVFTEEDPVFSLDKIVQRIREVVLPRWGDGDRLLLSGPAVMNAITLAEIAKARGTVPLLLFAAQTSTYVERVYDGQA